MSDAGGGQGGGGGGGRGGLFGSFKRFIHRRTDRSSKNSSSRPPDTAGGNIECSIGAKENEHYGEIGSSQHCLTVYGLCIQKAWDGKQNMKVWMKMLNDWAAAEASYAKAMSSISMRLQQENNERYLGTSLSGAMDSSIRLFQQRSLMMRKNVDSLESAVKTLTELKLRQSKRKRGLEADFTKTAKQVTKMNNAYDMAKGKYTRACQLLDYNLTSLGRVTLHAQDAGLNPQEQPAVVKAQSGIQQSEALVQETEKEYREAIINLQTTLTHQKYSTARILGQLQLIEEERTRKTKTLLYDVVECLSKTQQDMSVSLRSVTQSVEAINPYHDMIKFVRNARTAHAAMDKKYVARKAVETVCFRHEGATPAVRKHLGWGEDVPNKSPSDGNANVKEDEEFKQKVLNTIGPREVKLVNGALVKATTARADAAKYGSHQEVSSSSLKQHTAHANHELPINDKSISQAAHTGASGITKTGIGKDADDRVVAMFDHDGDDDETDLSFRVGDVIAVVQRDSSGWHTGRLCRTGRVGLFPEAYTRSQVSDQNSTKQEQTTCSQDKVNEPKKQTERSNHASREEQKKQQQDTQMQTICKEQEQTIGVLSLSPSKMSTISKNEGENLPSQELSAKDVNDESTHEALQSSESQVKSEVSATTVASISLEDTTISSRTDSVGSSANRSSRGRRSDSKSKRWNRKSSRARARSTSAAQQIGAQILGGGPNSTRSGEKEADKSSTPIVSPPARKAPPPPPPP